MHNDPRTDKNIIYTHLIQDLINNEGEMQWSSKTTVERMNREFALGFITKLAMFRAGYSMQADGTMARSTGTGDEYTVHYVDEMVTRLQLLLQTITTRLLRLMPRS